MNKKLENIDFVSFTANLVHTSILTNVYPTILLENMIQLLELPDPIDREFLRRSVGEEIYRCRDTYPFEVDKPRSLIIKEALDG